MTNIEKIVSYFQGVYEIKSKSLIKQGVKGLQKFTIGTRKNPTPTKPLRYLLDTSSKKVFYVSSIYPTKEEHNYKIEFKGVWFDLEQSDTTYQIKYTYTK